MQFRLRERIHPSLPGYTVDMSALANQSGFKQAEKALRDRPDCGHRRLPGA
jgi:hypothetical protein